jgi:predicted transcriptional regulator of viral defense system
MHTSNKRRLSTGPMEARLLTELDRAGISVLSLPKHRSLLKDITSTQLRDTIHNLSEKGWLIKLQNGKYVVAPRAARGSWTEHPFVLASEISPDDHYISFWSALSFHQLTEQLPRIVYVVLRNKQKRALAFDGWQYRFVSFSERKFFGFRLEAFPALNGANTVNVPVAEPEKAIIDSIEHQHYAGGLQEVLRTLSRGLQEEKVSIAKLLEYIKRLNNAALTARVGFILDRFSVKEARELLPYIRHRGIPPSLSTSGSTKGHLDRQWYLYNNVPDIYFAPEEVY